VSGHLILAIAVVIAALAFDFINSFHDAANSIATIVSPRVLTPFRAVLWAAATQLGIPVSTTHAITGSIVGLGSISSPGRLRWGIATRIVWAWIFTIPASALVASITYFVARAVGV
jgi:phosphate/sulfate permease